MKTLNERFTEAEYAALKDAKDGRKWRTAILDEFDVPEEVRE